MTIEIGKTYQVNHSRKGTFRARVETVDDPEWITVTVLEEVTGRSATWEAGETMEVRRSMASFTPVES